MKYENYSSYRADNWNCKSEQYKNNHIINNSDCMGRGTGGNVRVLMSLSSTSKHNEHKN